MTGFTGRIVPNDRDRSPLEEEAPQSVAVIGGVGGETEAPRNGTDQSRREANVAQMAGCHFDGDRVTAGISPAGCPSSPRLHRYFGCGDRAQEDETIL
jgi:hypothetical protein